MSGIYIHIPFCKKACIYCDFHFSTSRNYSEIIDSILTEIQLNQKKIKKNKISTIYFGGGTPSIIDIKFIDKSIKSIIENHDIEKECEVTIEANPDDITIKKLKSWKDIGFNRLSLGVQTFDETSLKILNRTHNKDQALKAIQNIQKEFNNYSIDIMFGTPGSNIKTLKNDINYIKKIKPPHISIYSLDIEEETPLHKLIRKRKIELPSSIVVSKQFDLINKSMDEMNYINYEISSFCKKGFKSKHNSNYWCNENYIGYGPGAHSYDKKYRYWNIRDNKEYVNRINNRKSYFESEKLTNTQKINEFIITRIRTMEGINNLELKNLNGICLFKEKDKEIKYLKDESLIDVKENRIVLTNRGKKIVDNIIEKISF